MKAMGPGDALIVCGSFYLAGEIRDQLKGKLANLQPDRLLQKNVRESRYNSPGKG